MLKIISENTSFYKIPTYFQLENQKNDLVMFAKRIEEECGLKVDISNNQTYIISLGGLTKADDELCNCELTVDTSTIAKGEYKRKNFQDLTLVQN